MREDRDWHRKFALMMEHAHGVSGALEVVVGCRAVDTDRAQVDRAQAEAVKALAARSGDEAVKRWAQGMFEGRPWAEALQTATGENRLDFEAKYRSWATAQLRELCANRQDLAKPGLKLVFAAREVPVGQYSLDFLDKAAAAPSFSPTYKDAVLRNVVSYENDVRAVLAKVALGEADAGIVYTSDISGENGDKVGELEIPDALNVIASYPIAPVKEGKNRELSQAFIDLVLSAKGQEILAKYKFIPVR